MNKTKEKKIARKIQNNIFLNQCNTEEILATLGFKDNPISKKTEKIDNHIMNNLFLNQCNTSTALEKLHPQKIHKK